MLRLMPFLILFLMATGLAQAAKLYRWEDENGKVFYSDKVPPKAAEHQRKTLDKRGRVLESTARAKTAEEMARDAELKRRREAQQRLAAEQKKRDDLLLSTYQHEDDIVMTRDGKITAIDARARIIRTSLKYSQERLARIKVKAGPNPKGKDGKEIERLEAQVKRYHNDILNLEKRKQGIRISYARDLARYRELKSPGQVAQQIEKEEVKVESGGVQLENVLICEMDCNVLWRKVKQFVQKQSAIGIDVAGDSIIMTKPPLTNTDIGLSVSRNHLNGGSEEIFLDLQCKDTVAGQQHCQGATAKQILKEFKALKQP